MTRVIRFDRRAREPEFGLLVGLEWGLDSNSSYPPSSGPGVAPDHADAAVWLAGHPFQQMVQDTASPPRVPGSVPTEGGGFSISPVKFTGADGMVPEPQDQASERDRLLNCGGQGRGSTERRQSCQRTFGT